MTHPTSVLLFAAGLGTRMAPLTKTMPKPLVKVGDKTLLDHALDHCAGLKRVVNVHYFADQMRAHLAGRDILISDETDRLLETGGGLKRALPLLDSNPAITLNTDAVWYGGDPIQMLRDNWVPDQMEALLLLIPMSRADAHPGSRYFDMDPMGRLTLGSSYIYTGAQIIRTDGLAQIPDDAFSMWDLWSGMLERGSVFGVVFDGNWCDVGRPESIPTAEAMLRGDADV